MTMTKERAATTTPITWQSTKSKWQSTESKKQESFDSNDVIDAYYAGRKDGFTHGMNEMQRATTELLKNNAAKVAAHTLTVLDFLKKHNHASADAYLKVLSWDELDVLVLVEEESFLQPSFKEVYNLVYDLEEVSEQDNLGLNFSFAPRSESFSYPCMNADGFSLKLNAEIKSSVEELV